MAGRGASDTVIGELGQHNIRALLQEPEAVRNAHAQPEPEGPRSIYGYGYSDSSNYQTQYAPRVGEEGPGAGEKGGGGDGGATIPGEGLEDTNIDSFAEFTLNTTFHGIRYIFHNGGMTLRRIGWVAMVFTAIVLFTYQVADRATTYFEYHSNVNVEVVYADDVLFPSVTLCNQNNFRITAAVEDNMYEFLDYVYSTSNVTGLDVSNFTITDEGLVDFYKKVGHQLNNFIHSCKWQGVSCDFDRDFSTTPTDFGICYTFNHKNSSQVLKVTQSGSKYALSLVLNIEEYEYMKGPHGEAGVKLLLHDPRETPLVGDLGFSVAPGTHTLIGVNREEINSLSSPYGNCIHGAQPRSLCQVECRAQHSAEHCACVDAYMPQVTNATFCSVEDASICLRILEDTSSSLKCACSIPCERVSYSPELSYSILSKLNIHKTWQGDPEQKDAVLESYIRAREVTQRVDPDIASRDRDQLTSITDAWEELKDLVQTSKKSINDPGYLLSVLNISRSPVEGYESFTETLGYVEREYRRRGEIVSTAHPDTVLLEAYMYILYSFLNIRNDRPNGFTRYILQHCSEIELYNTSSVDISFLSPLWYECDEGNVYSFMYYTRSIVSPSSARVSEGMNMYKGANITRHTIYRMEAEYLEEVDQIYGNTSSYQDVLARTEHNACAEEIRNQTEALAAAFLPLQGYFDSYLNTTSWTAKLQEADQIFLVYNQTVQFLSKESMKSCEWILQEDYLLDASWELYNDHSAPLEDAYFDLKTLSPLLTSATDYIRALQAHQPTLIDPFRDYLSGRLNKTYLYTHLSGAAYLGARSDLLSKHNSYLSLLSGFVTQLTTVEHGIKNLFGYLYNTTLPLMVYNTTYHLPLLEYVRTEHARDVTLQEMIARLPGESLEGVRTMEEVVVRMFGGYKTLVAAKMTEIQTLYTGISGMKDQLQQDLKIFTDGNQIDENFFLANYIKLDVFYKELSYTQVKQQKAFEFISFLSEIGGFLGLLLGASVLTVCELLDYVSLLVMKKLRKRKLKQEACAKVQEPEVYITPDPMTPKRSFLDLFGR